MKLFLRQYKGNGATLRDIPLLHLEANDFIFLQREIGSWPTSDRKFYCSIIN